jgi:chromate transport protein ChrA
MVALLATAYVHLHGLPWLTAITYGVSPAVIALILQSWWRLVRLGMEDRFQYVIAAVSVMATLVLPGILTAVFLGAGLLGVGWYSLQARRRAAAPRLHDVASFVLLAKMAWFFLITGAFTFGGGLAVVPLLQKGLVEQGWFSSRRRHSCAIAPIRSCRVSSRASDRRGRFGCAAALPHQRSAPGRIGGGRRPGDVPIPAPRLGAGSLASEGRSGQCCHLSQTDQRQPVLGAEFGQAFVPNHTSLPYRPPMRVERGKKPGQPRE